jgi:hypothetical protein
MLLRSTAARIFSFEASSGQPVLERFAFHGMRKATAARRFHQEEIALVANRTHIGIAPRSQLAKSIFRKKRRPLCRPLRPPMNPYKLSNSSWFVVNGGAATCSSYPFIG